MGRKTLQDEVCHFACMAENDSHSLILSEMLLSKVIIVNRMNELC